MRGGARVRAGEVCARRQTTLFVDECEDRVLDGPASGEKGSKGGPSMYCNPRT